MAFVVECHIERLGIGTELRALQVAPFVAHRAQRAFPSVLGYLYLFRQRRLVIYEERDQHVVLRQSFGYRGVCPYCGLHLAAIHATKAREINQHRLALRLCGSHALLVVGILGTHLIGLIEIEILC